MIATRKSTRFAMVHYMALAAMILRALLPVGWMPAAGGQIVICTGHGPVLQEAARLGDLDDGGSQHRPAHKHDHPCAFSGHGVGAAPPIQSSGLALLIWTSSALVLPGARFLAPGRGLAAPPPPSHAPPAAI